MLYRYIMSSALWIPIIRPKCHLKHKTGTSMFTECVHAPQWINLLHFDNDSSVAYPLSQHIKDRTKYVKTKAEFVLYAFVCENSRELCSSTWDRLKKKVRRTRTTVILEGSGTTQCLRRMFISPGAAHRLQILSSCSWKHISLLIIHSLGASEHVHVFPNAPVIVSVHT